MKDLSSRTRKIVQGGTKQCLNSIDRVISLTLFWGTFSTAEVPCAYRHQVAPLWAWGLCVRMCVHINTYFYLWFFNVKCLKCEGNISDWCFYKMMLRVPVVCLGMSMYYMACWEPNLSHKVEVLGVNHPQNCTGFCLRKHHFFHLKREPTHEQCG